MENLPKNALSNLVAYIGCGTRALLAVALTAPSPSWEQWDSTKVLSQASRIVMSSPYYMINAPYEERWEDFSLLGIEDSLRSKLSDGDICGILVCIDARSNLKKLELPHFVHFEGHGLAPLRDSTSLEVIDLSLECFYASPAIKPESMLSQGAVLPILQRIIGNKKASIKLLILPKTWREERTEALGQFLDSFNRVLNGHKLNCSNCDGLCVGTSEKPWMLANMMSDDYGAQNLTCHYCANWFCQDCDGESDHGVQFCPLCEGKYCQDCIPVETCSECLTTSCDRSRCKPIYVACDICEKAKCEDCSDSFYCDACDQWICKSCCLGAKCQNYNSCHQSCCTDCASNNVGHVKLCKLCGQGFCTDCKPMDYCFHIGGDVCPDCHRQNHDIIDCYWKVLPPKLRELMPTFREEVLSIDSLRAFWLSFIQLVGTDKEFDQETFGKTKQAEMASYIIAVDYLLKDMDNEAVYMLHYGGAMNEISKRGPDYANILSKEKSDMPTEKLFCIHLDMFHNMIVATASREHIVRYLENEILSTPSRCRNSNREQLLRDMLNKVDKSNFPIHCIDSVSEEEYARETNGTYGESLKMNITISNMDNVLRLAG